MDQECCVEEPNDSEMEGVGDFFFFGRGRERGGNTTRGEKGVTAGVSVSKRHDCMAEMCRFGHFGSKKGQSTNSDFVGIDSSL